MSIEKKIRDSFLYRVKHYYEKIAEHYWHLVNMILTSNKRDTRHKKILFIYAPVWGKWHIDTFFKYTLPSLMQSGNLPAISKDKKIVINFYTKDNDIFLIDSMMKEVSCTYDYNINSESNFNDDTRGMMVNFLIHILDICVKENGLMLLAQPDLIYSNNSVKNLVDLSNGKGVSIAVPHPRVSYECIKEVDFFDSPSHNEVSSESLVKIALSCKHKAFELSDELLDINSTVDGISTHKIDELHMGVVHNLPSVYLFSPIKDDISYFKRRTTFNYIDTAWPSMLFRQSRLKVIASSKIAFVVELTKDADKRPRTLPNMKYNDQYLSSNKSFCNYSNVIINSWDSFQ
jgi:hypothetical protein